MQIIRFFFINAFPYTFKQSAIHEALEQRPFTHGYILSCTSKHRLKNIFKNIENYRDKIIQVTHRSYKKGIPNLFVLNHKENLNLKFENSRS